MDHAHNKARLICATAHWFPTGTGSVTFRTYSERYCSPKRQHQLAAQCGLLTQGFENATILERLTSFVDYENGIARLLRAWRCNSTLVCPILWKIPKWKFKKNLQLRTSQQDVDYAVSEQWTSCNDTKQDKWTLQDSINMLSNWTSTGVLTVDLFR